MHVYAITNLETLKIYVGQYSKDDLEAYFQYNLHAAFLPSAVRHKPALYRAIRKYGVKSFVIRSLIQSIDKDQMDKLETFFIRTLETQKPEIGYNISPGGGMGGLFTEEHIKALSEGQRGKPKRRSLEHAEKISENKKLWWAERKKNGFVVSEETKAKTSKSLKEYYADAPEEVHTQMSARLKKRWADRTERRANG